MITAQILSDLEQKYGGIQRIDGKRGGDRMLYKPTKGSKVYHAYSPIYAQFLPPKIEVLVELGILQGTGLAIWADVYPEGRIIGLEQNLLYFRDFKPSLRTWGAFQRNNAEVYQFDKFAKKNKKRYEEILQGQMIDVYIDDSNHTTEGVVKAFKDVRSFLKKGAVCFLEDNDEVGMVLQKMFPKYVFHIEGRMTVVQI